MLPTCNRYVLWTSILFSLVGNVTSRHIRNVLLNLPEYSGLSELSEDHLCTAETFLEISRNIPAPLQTFLIADLRIPRFPTITSDTTIPDLPTVTVSYDNVSFPLFQGSRNETAFQSVERYMISNGIGSQNDVHSILSSELAQFKLWLMNSYYFMSELKNYHVTQPLGVQYYRTAGLDTSLIVPHWGLCHRRASDFWLPFLPLFDFRDRPIRYLEVGVNYGCNAKAVALSYAMHPASKIYLVDPWIDYEDYADFLNIQSDIYSQFLANINILAPVHRNKFVIQRGFSGDEIGKFSENYFDLIYIDGNHQSRFVLEDAVMSFRKLKIGGFLIFDDAQDREVESAIFAFVTNYFKYIKAFSAMDQVFIEKRV